jgi:hypothetical protein
MTSLDSVAVILIQERAPGQEAQNRLERGADSMAWHAET